MGSSVAEVQMLLQVSAKGFPWLLKHENKLLFIDYSGYTVGVVEYGQLAKHENNCKDTEKIVWDQIKETNISLL